MDYLPKQYRNSQEDYAITMAMDESVAALRAALEDVKSQLSLESATWGLEYWERAVGLTVDYARSLDLRRAKVKAKLRGQGTTTVAMVKSVAQSYTGSQVEVVEYPGEYRFELRLFWDLGDGAKLGALKGTLGEILPAHLAFCFCIVFPRSWVEEQNRGWLERLRVSARSYERGNRVNRLDGMRRLDGTWILDGVDEYRPALERLRVSAHVWQPLWNGVAVTVDSMWRLDGAWRLDGHRKLDAEIVRREI